jgi:carbamoyltransferase
MVILGVHLGHDSSAAIVKDGKIIADVQEERFSRIKHSGNFPFKSIEFCLKMVGLKDINEVDYISYSSENTSKITKMIFDVEATENQAKKLVRNATRSVLNRFTGTDNLKLPIYYPNYKLKDKNKFLNNNHHLAHAASAYFTRKSADKCLIFSIDGAGDGICTSIWMGEGSEIKLLKSFYKEACIGWAYSIVTEALHWIHGDGEGKTMGLAPYGDPSKCNGVLDSYFPVFKGCELVKSSEVGDPYYWKESGSVQFHLDEAKVVEQLIEKYGRENIAAEAQRKLEETVMELVFGWIEETGVHNVAFAGGVMLNVKLNQRIWNNRGNLISEQHIYPNPGDSGLAVGAAFLAYYKYNEFKGYDLNNLYLGPEYTNEEIETILKIRKCKYIFVENPSKKAAELLAENKIIAWFQGRMESGPRALGNRSILMSPLKSENKDIINKWVKFREGFRPFCPSLIYEKRNEYLEDCRDEFFMITSFDIKEEKRDAIPAVVHVDGTVRPQMVQKETNPRYWELINEFGNLTGEHIILNSSFNVMGEPVINTPKEAIRCFFDSGIDALFMGNFYIEK